MQPRVSPVGRRLLPAVALAALACPAPAQDQPAAERERPAAPEAILREFQELYPHNPRHEPEEEMAGFVVHPDFEVNLFAAEPWVINPVAMQWDAQGRLWVINSPMYPQVLPGQEYSDFISVLEDTDSDGRADECTVFYDELYVPTGLALGDGGVYVASQPDLLFLRDTDGDLVADERRVFLSGFGTEDNHHAISAFQWCPGGWLYFQSGIFLHSQVETPNGLVRLDDGGVFQLRPRTYDLRMFNVGTATNPWGHDFDRWGQSFLTEGPQGGIWYLTPATVAGNPRERVPGTDAPKSCGVEFIESLHFSEEYQNLMVLNAFKNRTVNLYEFSDDGAGYATRELQPLLIASNEEYFRPVDVKLGPDGALYIADFFQEIIGHMQYEFRDPRRDHLHGRIWRVTQRGHDPLPRPDLPSLPPDELVMSLTSPNVWQRDMARRLLYEMPQETAARTIAGYLEGLDPDSPEFEHDRLEGLWAYQTIDRVEPDLLYEVLRSPEPRARAAATRVLRYWLPYLQGQGSAGEGRLEAGLPEPLAILEELVQDEHPRVRLEALCALSYIPEPRAMELAAMVVDRPMDRFLEYALRHTAMALEPYWLPALESGEITFDNRPNRIQAALAAVNSADAVGPLLAMLRSGQISDDRRERVLTLIATLGGADQLAAMLDPATFAQVTTGDAAMLRDWQLAGPYEHDPNRPIAEQRHAPENGEEVQWQAATAGADGIMHLDERYGLLSGRVVYARTEINVEEAGAAVLGFQSDDRMQAFLNGQSIYTFDQPRGLNGTPDEVRVMLGEGRNELLVKVANDTGNWKFAVRLIEVEGLEGYDPELHARVLAALATTARQRDVRPSGDLAAMLRPLAASENVSLRAAAIRLAGVWQLAELHEQVVASAVATDVPAVVRSAAIGALADFGGDEGRAVLLGLSSADEPLPVRQQAVAGLAKIDVAAAAEYAAELLGVDPGETDASAVVHALVSRRGGDAALLEALEGGVLNETAARQVWGYLNASGSQSAELVAFFREALGVGGLSVALVEEPVDQLVAEVLAEGDAHRGERVFRRRDLQCMTCHAVSRGGPNVGPDLEGVGTSSPPDYILESLLEPNAQIREGYEAFTVATIDGEVITGVRVAHDATELVLRDAATRELVHIRSADIDEMVPAASIMPQGVIDSLTRADFIDLARFLMELGRPGEFAARNLPVVRTWRVLPEVPEALAWLDPSQPLPADLAVSWQPAYSLVSGELPLADMRGMPGGVTGGTAGVSGSALGQSAVARGSSAGDETLAFVRFHLDVGTPGRLVLRINDSAGIALWADGQPVAVDHETLIDVDQGDRAVTLRVDRAARDVGLRIEVEPAPGSAARAQIVNGP